MGEWECSALRELRELRVLRAACVIALRVA
jgi:hypothetical protein